MKGKEVKVAYEQRIYISKFPTIGSIFTTMKGKAQSIEATK